MAQTTSQAPSTDNNPANKPIQFSSSDSVGISDASSTSAEKLYAVRSTFEHHPDRHRGHHRTQLRAWQSSTPTTLPLYQSAKIFSTSSRPMRPCPS